MAEKKESLFRKKSTEYLDSPEKLDQYLHVTSPGIWALLLTIIVLLVGFFAWCVLGRIEAYVEVAVVTNHGQTVCLVPQVALDPVIDHPEVVVDGETFKLLPDTLEPAMVSESTNIYILLAGNLKVGDIVYSIPVEGQREDGITKGTIFYDRKDTRRLDMRSVRKQIGTVMQDGKLFQGSIYENISISSPGLSLEEAWEAAEMAGFAEDIRRMPMGMHTMVSEGAGGISGGQRQRLMIARAVASKPKVLFFDEATSALDNITQKHVSESLDRLRSTRIVIAHRLSTIKNCDRILVLDQGKIIEDGNYEELIAKDGFFAELVKRQM